MPAFKKYWFLRLVRVSGVLKVRPLEGQTITVSDLKGTREEDVNDELHVTCDKEIREKVPLNTVFATDSLKNGGSYYRAGKLSTIEFFDGVEVCTTEAYRQYEELADRIKISKVKHASKPADDDDDSVPSKTPLKKTPLMRLIANAQYTPPTIADNGFYVDKDTWYFLVYNALKKEPTILTGPTGTGKTEVIEYVARKTEKGFEEIDMAGMLDPVSGLIGTHRIENGESAFDYARFTQVVKTDSIVLLDELSRPTAQTNNILFPALDRRRYVPVEIASSKGERRIHLHEDCVIFATANLGVEYTGTHRMDKALMDRFTPVEFTYLPEDIETDLLELREKTERNRAIEVVGIANQIRELYLKGELSNSVSTRHTLKAAKLITYGYAIHDALSRIFLPLFEGGDGESERSKVELIFISK